jgi:hypothetical protein
VTTVYRSPLRDREYVRRFDHEEAARRRANGERLTDLAREYGVSKSAVAQAIRNLTPEGREAYRESHRAYQRSGVCEVCGGTATVMSQKPTSPDGRNLCARCRRREERTSVRLDDDGNAVWVRCTTCREWRVPADFTRGQRYPDLREGGFHNQCRPCNTVLRRSYRQRNRVPCEDCGTPVEGKGRANTRGPADRPYLCRPCAMRRLRAAA